MNAAGQGGTSTEVCPSPGEKPTCPEGSTATFHPGCNYWSCGKDAPGQGGAAGSPGHVDGGASGSGAGGSDAGAGGASAGSGGAGSGGAGSGGAGSGGAGSGGASAGAAGAGGTSAGGGTGGLAGSAGGGAAGSGGGSSTDCTAFTNWTPNVVWTASKTVLPACQVGPQAKACGGSLSTTTSGDCVQPGTLLVTGSEDCLHLDAQEQRIAHARDEEGRWWGDFSLLQVPYQTALLHPPSGLTGAHTLWIEIDQPGGSDGEFCTFGAFQVSLP